jgi:hypothetical protein
MISRSQIFAGFVWILLATIFACTVIGFAVALSGCGPKPDTSVVLWDQPAPKIAAEAHAKEKPFHIASVVVGKSMEPLITAGDWCVFDASANFADIRAGQICIYSADFAATELVIHMAAAKSGDGWKMDGIGNRAYDPGVMRSTQYWGKVVQVYTWRAKP